MPGSATVTIGEKQWTVDVAASPDELQAGLGGVESIPANTGMLFDLGSEQTIQVTTEPMLFNIDIIFINEALEVVDVVENVAPGYLVTEETPVRYFLEVNAGEAEGIESGDSVEITGYEYTPPSTISQWMPMIMQIAVLGFVAAMVGGMASVAFGPGDAAYRRKYLPPGVSPPGRRGLEHHSNPEIEQTMSSNPSNPQLDRICPVCKGLVSPDDYWVVERPKRNLYLCSKGHLEQYALSQGRKWARSLGYVEEGEQEAFARGWAEETMARAKHIVKGEAVKATV